MWLTQPGSGIVTDQGTEILQTAEIRSQPGLCPRRVDLTLCRVGEVQYHVTHFRSHLVPGTIRQREVLTAIGQRKSEYD